MFEFGVWVLVLQHSIVDGYKCNTERAYYETCFDTEFYISRFW